MTAQIVSYTVSDNRSMPGGMCTVYVKWTSATGGTVSQKISELLSGKIVELITNPGATAPTDNYDITLVSALSGHDLLEGNGADRDTANTEQTLVFMERTIGVNVYGDNPAINEGGATFTIANAGDEKIGEAWIIIQ
jgi:hypothetical protein